jgi:hypothetical protein
MADKLDDPSPWRELVERISNMGRFAAGEHLPLWKRVKASSLMLASTALACTAIQEGVSWTLIAKAARTDGVEWDGLLLLWHVVLTTLPLTIWAFLWMLYGLHDRDFPGSELLFLGLPSLSLLVTVSAWLGLPHSRISSHLSAWQIWERVDPIRDLKIYLHYYGLALIVMSLLCGLALAIIARAWRPDPY